MERFFGKPQNDICVVVMYSCQVVCFLIVTSFFLAGCQGVKEVSVELSWNSPKELKNVESVIFDEDNNVLYASNGQDYQAGIDGFLSKVSLDGEILDLKWVDSLNRPTGMAIHNQKLYVADVNVLVIIDTKSGEILGRIPEPIPKSGLNDVAINSKGEIFVTGSFVHSVFKVNENQLELLAQDEERLAWANGILAMDDEVLVGGLHLNKIILSTKEIVPIRSDSAKDFDGIASDGQGGYYLTTVENSALWYLNAQFLATKLIADEDYLGDLVFIPQLNKLIIARGNHEKKQYYLAAYYATEHESRQP